MRSDASIGMYQTGVYILNQKREEESSEKEA